MTSLTKSQTRVLLIECQFCYTISFQDSRLLSLDNPPVSPDFSDVEGLLYMWCNLEPDSSICKYSDYGKWSSFLCIQFVWIVLNYHHLVTNVVVVLNASGC